MTALAWVVVMVLPVMQTEPSGPAPPIGRDAVEALTFPPLAFDPPRPEEHEVLGVPVFHLADHTLPLVDVHIQLRGGMGHFPRGRMASFLALPVLLRTGGTLDLPPDSVDRRIELLALDLSFAGGGGGMAVSMNGLTRSVEPGLELLREMLLHPRFDRAAVNVWRGQEIERVLRSEDDPGGLAISAFNRLLFGDHPVGWVVGEEDLAPERLTEQRIRDAHSVVVCRDRLVVGISGDVEWEAAESLIGTFLEPWPECSADLVEPPPPELRHAGEVFVLPQPLDQSTIIVAGPGGVLQADSPEYFASQIADYILGGSGLGSRLLARLRTEEGLTYAAYSLWTASPLQEGMAGAATATRPERTIEATRLLIDALEEMREAPPTYEEVARAQGEITNGYVFAFRTAAQIVSRRMSYRAMGLPEGWLERYLEGMSEVTPEALRQVALEHLDVAEMTILILGDPSRFDPGLESFERIFTLDPDGNYEPWTGPSSVPGGAP